MSETTKCSRCKQPAVEGMTQCQMHRELNKQRAAELRRAAKAAGMCPHCRTYPTEPGRAQCDRCRTHRRFYSIAKSDELRQRRNEYQKQAKLTGDGESVSLLIGFGHRARNGKDTCATAIVDARGGAYDVKTYAFATELKREYVEAVQQAGSAWELINQMRVTHNLPDWVQYEFDAPKDDPICGEWGKQRTMLQWWGEWRRGADPFYFVKLVRNRIHTEEPKVALITDLRYPNEALFIKVNKGYTVEVRREGFPELTPNDHISERALAGYPFDIVITAREGELEQLKVDAVGVFDMIVDWVSPRDIEEEQRAKAA